MVMVEELLFTIIFLTEWVNNLTSDKAGWLLGVNRLITHVRIIVFETYNNIIIIMFKNNVSLNIAVGTYTYK